MRAIVQRVRRAKVTVDGHTVGEIGTGLLVLLGVTHDDGDEDARYMADKIAGLRVFEDSEGKMNLSVEDVGGSILSVSQFTLYGDCRKGRRPSFAAAARPEHAAPLYERFNDRLRERGLRVETGSFGAAMEVELVNWGPVTLVLDSRPSA